MKDAGRTDGRTDGRTISVVLVVDDDARVLNAAKRSLGGDFVVLVAADLTSARAVFNARHPDFLIVDQWLGLERGINFLSEVKRTHPALPTALLSGALSPAVSVQATTVGIAVLAEKSRGFREILHELRAVPEPAPLAPVCLEATRRAHVDDVDAGPSFSDATRFFQRALLEHELDKNDWNRSRTARDLRVPRSWPYKLIEELEVDRSDD